MASRFDRPPAPLRALALYGGTFDPIHLGHIEVATAARRTFGFEAVRVLPAAQPPLRGEPGASAEQRLAMVRMVCAARAGFVADGRELKRDGPSYTIETLMDVRAEVGPRKPLAWLVGRDAVANIDRWYCYEDLLEVAHFVVLDRPGPAEPFSPTVQAWVDAHRCDDRTQVHAKPAGHVFFFDGPRIDISSSQVRALCAAGESAARLLPPKVWAYIRDERLYGASDAVRDSQRAQS